MSGHPRSNAARRATQSFKDSTVSTDLANGRRQRLLLCWGYHRAGWIEPFERLRDRFDVAYLFYRTPEEEEGCLTDAPRFYWSDFPNAQAVLDRLGPGRVVFMALDGARSIGLNAVAKKRGIPTLIVHHGHLVDDPDQGNKATASLKDGSPLSAVRFVARSFGPSGLGATIRTVQLMRDVRAHGPQAALPRHRFDARVPDLYVALSPESAKAHVRQDGVDPTRVRCIGVPEYDRVFQETSRRPPTGGPLLLIDSPNAENRWGITTMSKYEKSRMLEHLDCTAGAAGLRLIVKLHPETYEATWLPRLSNGTYLRDAEMHEQFDAASVCLGFDSTLMIPAVWLRPTIFFSLRPSRIIDLAGEVGAGTIVNDPLSISTTTFVEAAMRFDDTESARSEYVSHLAFSPDGRAVERLAAVLAGPIPT